MFKDLIIFIKDPYLAIIISVQWVAMGIIYSIDRSVNIVLMLATTMASSLIMLGSLTRRNR